MDEKTKSLQPLIALIMALSTAFLGVVTLRDTWDTQRPAMKASGLSSAIGKEDVTSRLWEDPLGAVIAGAELHQGSDSNHQPAALRADVHARLAEYSGGIRILVALTEGQPFAEEFEVRLRQRYALQLALHGNGLRAHDRTRIGFVRVPWEKQVLASAVDSSAYETTHRDSILIPFEWFKPETNGIVRTNAAVLVLWVPEEEIADAPLPRLALLLDELLPRTNDSTPASPIVLSHAAQPCVQVSILGPRSSDTLRRMATGDVSSLLWNWRRGANNGWGLVRRLDVWSYSASAPDAMLLPEAVASRRLTLAHRIEAAWRGLVPGVEPHFHNLGTTDDELARLLVEELRSREIAVEYPGQGQAPSHRILLITEADSFYGRSLPVAFAAAAQGVASRPESLIHIREELSALARASSPIVVAQYLRGLDGLSARGSKSAEDTKKRDLKAEDVLRQFVEPKSQTASGESQFDYVDRWSLETQRQNEAWRRQAKSPFDIAGVRAIGIFGNDFYDKLTILQALKPRFPEAIFFTTELDARMLDPGASHLTRNLVVASAYPLKPHPGGGTESLRASNQVGFYLAIEASLRTWGVVPSTSGPKDPANRVLPHLYEIGRSRPVELSVPGLSAPPTQSLWAQMREHLFRGRLLFGILPLVGGIGFAWRLAKIRSGLQVSSADIDTANSGTPRIWQRGVLVGLSIAVFVTCFVLVLRASRELGGEPMALLEGVGAWPTELVRVAVVCLSLCMILWCYLQHRVNRERYWREYFAPTEATPLDGSLVQPSGDNDSGSVGRSQVVDAARVFAEYFQAGRLRRRLREVAMLAGLFGVTGFGLFFLLGFPIRPIRGFGVTFPDHRTLDLLLLVASIFGFILVVCYVAYSVMLAIRLLQQLANGPTQWPSRVVQQEAERLGFGPPWARFEHSKALEGLIDVRFCADLTREAGHRIYLPLLIMFLMIVSRSRLIDNWGWPPALLLINILSFGGIITLAFLLRRSANTVRQAAIRELNRQMVATSVASSVPRPSKKELKMILEQTEAIHSGSFASAWQDPMVLALLIPTGGYGLLVALFRVILGDS